MYISQREFVGESLSQEGLYRKCKKKGMGWRREWVCEGSGTKYEEEESGKK
jgi:hypothetical protein